LYYINKYVTKENPWGRGLLENTVEIIYQFYWSCRFVNLFTQFCQWIPFSAKWILY